MLSSYSYWASEGKLLETVEVVAIGIVVYIRWEWISGRWRQRQQKKRDSLEPDFKQGKRVSFSSATSLVKEYFHQYKNGANAIFLEDAAVLALEGWEPRSQLWSSGQFKWYHTLDWVQSWRPPSGTLTVTYEKKARKSRR